MDESELKQGARGHFKNVVHEGEVPPQPWGQAECGIGLTSREVAIAAGAKDLGYCIVSIEPGKRSCPFHFHHSEEEFFFVLAGIGILRQGDDETEERLEVAKGDVISYPAGTGIAHQFLNEGDEPFTYLAVSNRLKHDVAEYPDSDKILVRGSGHLLRRTPKLNYFDGEALETSD